MMKANMSHELTMLFERKDLQQKAVAVDSKIPNSTLSEYRSGKQPVPIEKAVMINDSVGDDHFASQLAYLFTGFFKAMDGRLSQLHSTNDLEILQQIESEERKERRAEAQKIIVYAQVRQLDEVEKSKLISYINEFWDEVVVELSIIFSLSEIVDVSATKLFEERMPLWIEKEYMKG